MRPNAQRAKTAIAFLWIYLSVEVISGISYYFQMRLLQDANSGRMIDMATANANDMRQLLIAVVFLLVYIGTIITFIMWFRRGYYNLHRIVPHLSQSERWAAGAWFVPILNLFRPYTIMKEMVYETEDVLAKAELIERKNRVRQVGIWWALWISYSVISNIISRIELKNDDIDSLIFTSGANVIISVLCIPLTIITVRMIKDYSQMETLLPSVTDQKRDIRLDNSDILDTI